MPVVRLLCVYGSAIIGRIVCANIVRRFIKLFVCFACRVMVMIGKWRMFICEERRYEFRPIFENNELRSLSKAGANLFYRS